MDLSVLSYNIHKGFDFLNQRFVLEEIKTLIREWDADIICLQEVLGAHDIHGKKLPEHFAESQMEFLADTVWQHSSYGKNAVYEEGHHGNCILSRHPISKTYNVDLTLHRFEQRGALFTEIDLPLGEAQGHKLHLYTTHLNLLHKHRDEQVEIICQDMKRHSSKAPMLLAGDFNDWNNKLGVETRLEMEGNPRRPTFPSFFPLMALDRVFYRNMELADFQVLQSHALGKISDHLPVFARFKL